MVSTQKTVTNVKAGITNANVYRACEVEASGEHGNQGARDCGKAAMVPVKMRGHWVAIWEEEKECFKGRNNGFCFCYSLL